MISGANLLSPKYFLMKTCLKISFIVNLSSGFFCIIPKIKLFASYDTSTYSGNFTSSSTFLRYLLLFYSNRARNRYGKGFSRVSINMSSYQLPKYLPSNHIQSIELFLVSNITVIPKPSFSFLNHCEPPIQNHRSLQYSK
jgi:hypothetical protein